MTTTIGYVTLEYANEYVTEHFVTDDSLRTNWESLLDNDKKVLLRKSFDAIESMPFTGRRFSIGQKMAFPRWPDAEVPDRIKAAQVENALKLSDNNAVDDTAFYEKMWQYGVDSYSIGNLSEHVSSGVWGRGAPAAYGVISPKATALLQPYLSGGYCIRGCKR